ncbi:MAG: non-homologous end-joining DNA ligase [Acidimicrobiia bacterium]|nr:non-homologous end-joining DNA ligase [Acidimicrobiia bacterium]
MASLVVEVAGREVSVSSPDRVVFPRRGFTKADLVRYYLGVGDGVMRAVRSRPVMLHRFPKGLDGESFYQKHVPKGRPEWLRTARVRFPSGRTAETLCGSDLAHVVWAVNLGCVDLHPWPTRRWDPEHPDELRVDLDPQPGVAFDTVRRVALEAQRVLVDHGLVGWPKTSGGRGLHISVRIVARYSFDDVRRAAVALAREVERRLPDEATTAWRKAERGARVLVDYNQNARDRTVASAWSVRPVDAALVSCPFDWAELDEVAPERFDVAEATRRHATDGDPHAGIDDAVGSLAGLLALADRDEAEGLTDAPWPPFFPAPGDGDGPC